MEDSDIEETVKISSYDAAFEIKIEDFRTATKQLRIAVKFVHTDKSFKYLFRVAIFPNLVEKKECWLVVYPISGTHSDLINNRKYEYLCCTVSIIDVEGKSRFPRSGQCSEATMFPHLKEAPKYMRKSDILKREEEFLPDGVLTLRVDFIFDSRFFNALYTDDFKSSPYKTFFLTQQSEDSTKPWKDIAEYSNIELFRVFDFTCKILKLPQFHEDRRRFGVYGFLESLEEKISSELEEVNPDNFEHVWMFDFKDEFQRFIFRFLVSLDEREDRAGTRLLKGSPVLRRMVNAPMREQQEKRIKLVNISNPMTFCYVLMSLDLGVIATEELDYLVDLYKFSHFYEMEELQLKCAESMAENSENESELEELEKIADHYQDKNLSELLKIRRYDYENLKGPLFRTYNLPNSDCYM